MSNNTLCITTSLKSVSCAGTSLYEELNLLDKRKGLSLTIPQALNKLDNIKPSFTSEEQVASEKKKLADCCKILIISSLGFGALTVAALIIYAIALLCLTSLPLLLGAIVVFILAIGISSTLGFLAFDKREQLMKMEQITAEDIEKNKEMEALKKAEIERVRKEIKNTTCTLVEFQYRPSLNKA